MAAACTSAANSTASAPNVSGPIDTNAGGAGASAAGGAAAGLPDARTATARASVSFTQAERISILLRADLKGRTTSTKQPTLWGLDGTLSRRNGGGAGPKDM